MCEVMTLYKISGLKTVTEVAMKARIVKVKREYQKAQAKARHNLDEIISFKAKQEP